MSKSNMVWERFAWLILPRHSSSKEIRTENQMGQEPRKGAESKAIKKCCLLDGSSQITQSILIQKLGSLALEWHHPQWAVPSPIYALLVKKIPSSWVLCRQILSSGPHCSYDHSLCKDDTKLAQTLFIYLITNEASKYESFGDR